MNGRCLAQAVGWACALSIGGAGGSDNLLAGMKPVQVDGVRGNPDLVTDGAVGTEGSVWDAPVAVVLERTSSALTYDLGQPRTIGAVYVQADANDTYEVSGSLD